MQIKAIVHTISSKRDTNGNCYHYAVVTSTLTGDSLHFHAGGESNARHMVYNVLGDHRTFHAVETELPIRQWERRAKDITLHEHNAEDKLRELLEKKGQG